jgi:hypothetical protein
VSSHCKQLKAAAVHMVVVSAVRELC